MLSKLQLFCISFIFLYSFSSLKAADVKQPKPELQILIDVSGSMKHNDPYNLRIPALKLLINLLPDNANAGIWLFAADTKVLVESGVANKKWKNKALSKIKKIHSSGLFTHIEDAIQRSSKDWFEKVEGKSRHLILLTDGVVDVSKDMMESAESRERILIEQVSQLQQAGVKVHTIALSENADSELLKKLAFDTNGWSETVQQAEQLQKVFFKILQQAIPKDSVPIEENGFGVDRSIDEFSVLIFKNEEAKETQLVTPSNKIIENGNKSGNVSWLSEKNYDLITIKKPEAGVWKIVAEMDPDNQVMIVTDLKFQVDEIPNSFSNQQKMNLSAYFSEKHQLISREDFLSLIEISIELINKKGDKEEWKMEPVIDKPGLFRQAMDLNLGEGKYIIKIKADGKTFQREITQAIEIVESIFKLEVDVNKDERIANIKLTPDSQIIDIKKMSIQASITQAGQATENRNLVNDDGDWTLSVEGAAGGSRKIVNFSVTANSVKGGFISPNIKPVVIDDDLFSRPSLTIEKDSKKEEKLQEAEVTSSTSELVDENESSEGFSWMKASVIVLVVNLMLIMIGFFAVKYFKKRAATMQAQLLARLE